MIPEILHDKALQQQIITGIKLLVYKYREPIANKIIDGIQRRSPEIIDMARTEVLSMIHRGLRKLPLVAMFSDEIASTIVACINWDNVEERLRNKVGEVSSSNLIQDELDRVMEACAVWLENDFVPMFEPQLMALAKGTIKDRIIAKLNLAERVAKAVQQQDVSEFHKMINDLAAKHLSAVQILGYFLGLIVGLLQLIG